MTLAAGSITADRVVRAGLCSGCGLCAALAGGEMQVVPPGYNRPRSAPMVDPATERLIAAACPGSVVAPWQAAADVHPLWGPYHQVLTGHSTDEAVRHQASSGGALTALLLFALETKRIDRVVQVVADPGQPTRNIVINSRTRDEIVHASGSRYAASSPLEHLFRTMPLEGRSAFVGKPCDASALRLLCGSDDSLNDRVPIVLSFFCAGVPSKKGVTHILREMGIDESELETFRFRGLGWPGQARAKTRDGRVAEMSYERSWGEYLSKDVQFRCKICPDAVGGVADVACGDAWYGGENGYPTFEEEQGRSLIITRTTTGEELVNAARSAGYLEASPLPVENIRLMQPSQAHRKSVVGYRIAALRTAMRSVPVVAGLEVRRAARMAPFRLKVRNFLGTLWRVVGGKI
jgi:coenzyme F420 hydrogenase subunit beta